jgi:copper chaperone
MPATYKVQGMTCEGCARSVTRAVAAVLPAVRTQVSVQSGTLTVDGEHDEAAVACAVEDAGFTFAGRGS